MGDPAWRDLLSRHYESARSILERYGGREIETTGDGVLATFAAPANAIRCVAEINHAAHSDGLQIRSAVHVGEMEMVGSRLRGIAVNEAARILGQADADEILVSEQAKAFAEGAGLRFEDRGLHELKGIPDKRRLFAYLE